ncbi:hypothetical protein BaRGS_00033990 [Batillaria attramentaria]|uniref:Uncharacterized protein n=1 Tax=Batillaria attramentaria TaxID=370345 RepID=A0ABD0JIG6_9CAEN
MGQEWQFLHQLVLYYDQVKSAIVGLAAQLSRSRFPKAGCYPYQAASIVMLQKKYIEVMMVYIVKEMYSNKSEMNATNKLAQHECSKCTVSFQMHVVGGVQL